jgi:His-Xaa-Ser system radical SAM maturase HxsC
LNVFMDSRVLTLVTSKDCNNNCVMCMADEIASEKVFSLRDLLNHPDKWTSKNGVKTITFSGGEPTLNKELPLILKELKHLFPHIELSLLSNGRMFRYANYAASFKGMDNFKVSIPLHGATCDLHDAITQTKGSFNQTLEGIENLLKEKIFVEIRLVINRLNYKELKETAAYAFRRFKDLLYFVFIPMELNKKLVKRHVSVRYSEFTPYLQEAIEGLDIRDRKRVKIYHCPLCVIEKKCWPLICKSIAENKLTFSAACERCFYKTHCMGILKSYVAFLQDKEFKAITTRYEQKNCYQAGVKVQ